MYAVLRTRLDGGVRTPKSENERTNRTSRIVVERTGILLSMDQWTLNLNDHVRPRRCNLGPLRVLRLAYWGRSTLVF